MTEPLSNCCGAKIVDHNGNYIGRCMDCKDNCGPDTKCNDCEQEMTLKSYIEKDGLCNDCARLMDK